MTALAFGRRSGSALAALRSPRAWVIPGLALGVVAVVVMAGMTGAVSVPASAVLHMLFGWTGLWAGAPLDEATVTVLSVCSTSIGWSITAWLPSESLWM